MKRFWSIFAVALVALVAVACDDNKIGNENTVPTPTSEEVTFTASAEDLTRTYLEDGGEVFHTKWVGNETLCVVSEGKVFKFVNTLAAANKFSCKEEGVTDLVGKSVEIIYTKSGEADGNVDSSAGAAGAKLSAVVTLENEGSYTLDVVSSFLLYSSSAEVTFTAPTQLFCDAGELKATMTLPAGNTVFVPIVATADAAECELSYTIGSEAAGKVNITPAYNRINDLGVLTSTETPDTPTPDIPEGDAAIFFVPNSGWLSDGAWFAAYYWNDATSASVKLTDDNADGIYEGAIPAGMTGMLFCRMNPAYTDFSWNSDTENDHVWNQTIDTTVGVAPANYFYIIGWDSGEWHEAGYVVPEAPTNIVYLVPNTSWTADGAWFAAYFWGDSASGSVKLTDDNADGIYEGAIPTGMTGMLFCRMNPAYSNFSWNSDAEGDHVWNQTADTTVGVAPANYFYITGWDSGEWHEAGYTLPDTPVTPSGSDFALAGTFNGWGDLAMANNNGIHSVKGVTMEAYAELKVKAATSWDVNFGAAAVAYMNPNNHIVVAQGGDNISITEAGTYDVYFDHAKLLLYVVTAGADYTTAPLQSVNGKEPEIVAPEVTDNVVYFKPNSTWGGSDARFSAYLWNDSGNTWVSAVDADADGIYEIYIPAGYGTNIIFCRMKSGTSANSWTNKQYQTVDLLIPTDGKNLFTVNEGGDKIDGIWSVK